MDTVTPTKEAIPQQSTDLVILEGVDDIVAVEDSEAKRNEAVRAAPFTWQGKTLQPFAIDREADWLAHRGAMERGSLHDRLSDPLTFLADAINILWLCSVDPDEWIGLSAFEVEKKVRAWARENIPSGEQENAITLAIEIFNRAHSTQAVAKPKVGDEGK